MAAKTMNTHNKQRQRINRCFGRYALRNKMKFLLSLLVFLPNTVLAGAWCEISDFTVDAYDHGGTYIHGALSRFDGPSLTQPVYEKHAYYLGLSGATEDATNRRTSVALAGQMGGKKLEVYFKSINTCANYTNYMVATTLRIK